MRRTLHYCPLLLLALCAAPVRGQDLGQQIGVLTVENAQGFVGPLARGIGHALTAGFVSSADPHGMLGFDLGVRLVGARFPTSDETFDVVLPATATYASPLLGSRTYLNPYAASGTGRSPTVAGLGSGVTLSPTGTFRDDLILIGRDPDDFNIQFLEGLDFPAAPFAAAGMRREQARVMDLWAQYALSQNDEETGHQMWHNARQILVTLELDQQVAKMDAAQPEFAANLKQ